MDGLVFGQEPHLAIYDQANRTMDQNPMFRPMVMPLQGQGGTRFDHGPLDLNPGVARHRREMAPGVLIAKAANGPRAPAKGTNCLGWLLRDIGQNRVPEPPQD